MRAYSELTSSSRSLRATTSDIVFAWMVHSLFQPADEPAEVTKTADERLETCQAQGICTIGKSSVRLVVNLHEDSVHARRHSGPGQNLDELGLAAAAAPFPPWQL